MINLCRTLFFVFAVPSLAVSVHAQWPDRHGPTLDGRVAPTDAAGLPTRWSETENIAWKTPLHGEGHSSPVIRDGRIWLTTATPDGGEMSVLCVDEQTGAILHDILLFKNDEVEPLGGAQGFNNYAAPSCVLEPGAVYVHFGSYGTARLDAETGTVVWQRRDLPCRHYRGPGSSPILIEDRLILTFDGVDQQYTAALDTATGKTLWRTDRSTEYGDLDEKGIPHREGDLRKAFCTPGPATIDGRVQLLSVGSRAMQSYDLRTGRELWTLRHKSYNAAIRPSWLPKEGLALINTGSRGARLIAVKLDESTTGDITESHVVWARDRGNPRFAKPIYHEGRLYQINDLGVVACLDAATGEEFWKERAPGNYRGSPILAGDHIYFFSEDGRGTVLEAGPTYREIAVSEVDGMGTTACPAVSKGAFFVRGRSFLYRISR